MIDWNQAIEDCIKSKQRQSDSFPDDPTVFRASSLSGCVRHCLKQRLNIEKLSIDTLKHFHIGTTIHRFLQTDVALGFIHEPVEFEKQIGFEMDGIKIRGHVDCVTETEIVDFKTTSNLKITLDYPIPTAYLYQLAAYKQGLLDKPRTTAILYVDKRNLQVYKKKVDTPPISKVIGFCKEVLIAEKKFQETGILEERDNCFNCIRELRVK